MGKIQISLIRIISMLIFWFRQLYSCEMYNIKGVDESYMKILYYFATFLLSLKLSQSKRFLKEKKDMADRLSTL